MGVPVGVGAWPRHEDFPVFPIGSKPKRMLKCPDDAQEPFLIPGHAYLFKTAVGWQAQQIWSEVIAYRLAALIRLDVPPCFIAVDEQSGETGALIEFFYGGPDEAEPVRFVHAAEFMTRLLADKKRGRPHAVQTNLLLCRLLRVASPIEWWGRALAFDTLIGNTDRHPENWGILLRGGAAGQPRIWSLAPAFDNGASLGYELPDAKLGPLLKRDGLDAYLRRGTHHCGWDRANDRRERHIELCRRYLDTYPEAGAAMKSVVDFDMLEVRKIVGECARYRVGIPFGMERANFVVELIAARRALLRAAFGD